ncbi:divalent-cation tolerance protein CutA [Patescibacteria group bacterium]
MKLIYTVCANRKEANQIGLKLIKNRLAVCVNIWPIDSIYYSQNKLVKDKEAVLLVKTAAAKVTATKSLIRKNHSYQAPAMLLIEGKSQDSNYTKWFNAIISQKKIS